jgi:CubicO group peptidase (beta-lactamase class C family)
LAAVLAGCDDPADPVRTGTTAQSDAPADQVLGSAPPTPSTSASGGGLAQRLTDTLKRYLVPTRENPKHPGYAGAVALVAVNGTVTAHVAVGDALRYGAGPVELSPATRVAMRPDSIFDLASITKVYTTLLVLQHMDPAAPVIQYLPEFDGPGKATITVSMLLAHTGGLPVGAKVTGLSTPAERRAAVLTTPLIAGAVPGTVFRYSSVGLMVLGQAVERITGQPLDQALRSGVTGPLGLRDTGFTPLQWLGATDRATRLVATDARSSRGLLRGVVHDDVANILGGVAGHAGLFGTAKDVAVIGQLLLNGGLYGGKRILPDATVRRMLTNVNPGLPAIDAERPDRTSTHGLGVELNQPWFMGRLASPATFGHTGFTGTSLLVHPGRRLVLVLLTNRAHPNWTWANPDHPRVAVANLLA